MSSAGPITSLVLNEGGPEPDATRGFWPQSEGVKLDASESCGSLAGNPIVVAVEGHDLVAEPDEAFAALQEACGRNKGVRLQLRSGEVLIAQCATPPSTPAGFSIISAPSIAIQQG